MFVSVVVSFLRDDLMVGSCPSNPGVLVEIKLTKPLAVVTDGTTLHPFDRHKPNQLLLTTDLNSYNILPCPAGLTLFILVLSFSNNTNIIQFQNSALHLQLYFLHQCLPIISKYSGLRLCRILPQSCF